MIESIANNKLSELSKIYQTASKQMQGVEQTGQDKESFGTVLKESIAKLNNDFAATDGVIKDYLAGDKEINDVVMAMEKLNLEFKLAVQVRNRLIEAYQEIMRMQV